MNNVDLETHNDQINEYFDDVKKRISLYVVQGKFDEIVKGDSTEDQERKSVTNLDLNVDKGARLMLWAMMHERQRKDQLYWAYNELTKVINDESLCEELKDKFNAQRPLTDSKAQRERVLRKIRSTPIGT